MVLTTLQVQPYFTVFTQLAEAALLFQLRGLALAQIWVVVIKGGLKF